MELETAKPLRRPLPSLQTSSNDGSKATLRALPPLSQTTISTLRTTALDESDNPNETVRNRSIARMKRRDKNLSRTLPLASVDDQGLNSKFETAPEDQESRASKASRQRMSRSTLKDTRSRSRKTNVDIPDTGPVLASMISDDDVLPVDHLDSHVLMTSLPGVTGAGKASQPQDKVYIQTTTGFKSHTKEWLATKQTIAANKNDSLEGDIYISRTSNVAYSFHRGFMFLAFTLHGVLAGISVWQVIFPFSLNAPGEINLIEQYAPLAQPIQTTYYILLAYCLLSALDRGLPIMMGSSSIYTLWLSGAYTLRYNLGGPGRNIFFNLIKFEPTAWLIAIYFIAFMLNVGISGLDFWLGRIAPILFRANETAPDAYLNADPARAVTTWLVLNVIRAVCAFLGWFIVSVRPTQDNTAEELRPENS